MREFNILYLFRYNIKQFEFQQGETDIAMVKHLIDDYDIELITITTDEDLQEVPVEMEKCIIKKMTLKQQAP